MAVRIFKRANDQGKADDEAHRRRGIPVDEIRHMVELALAKKQDVAASGEKGVDATKQAGDVWRQFVGRGRSSREAEKSSGRRVRFAQLSPKLLNGGSQQSRVNLGMSGVHVAKISGRGYDSFLVESFGRGNGGARGGGEYGVRESRRHQLGQEGRAVPTLESRPAKIDVVDFDALFDDVLCHAL